MDNQNKQNLTQNEDARCLASITTFIASSQQWLDVLSSLPLENKKQMTLKIADITKVSTNIIQTRSLQILQFCSQIEKCRNEIAVLRKTLNDLPCNESGLIQYMKKKHKLRKEISLLQRKITSLQSKFSSYRSEIDTYQTALDICSEFSRRLKFFLEYEEFFSS